MALYRVESPDGKLYEVEGPSGASHDEVLAAIQSQISSSPEPVQSAPDTGDDLARIAKRSRTNAVESTAEGMGISPLAVEDVIADADQRVKRSAEKNPKLDQAALRGSLVDIGLEDAALRKQLDSRGFVDTLTGMSLSDIPATLGAGALGTAAGAMELIGNDYDAKLMRDKANSLSRGRSAAIQNELSPTAGVVDAVGQSLPSMVAGIGVGGLVGKGLQAAVGSTRIGANAAIASEIAGSVGAKAPLAARAVNAIPAIGGAAIGEGGMSALGGANQAASEFDQLRKKSPDVIRSSTRYQELAAELGSDSAAMDALRDEAVNKGALYQGGATTVTGALIGALIPGIDAKLVSRIIGKTEKSTDSGAVQVAKATGGESFQEFNQSGAESIAGDLAAKTFDPTKQVGETALFDASMGGVTGALTGGTIQSVMTGADKLLAIQAERDKLEASRKLKSEIESAVTLQGADKVMGATSVEEAFAIAKEVTQQSPSKAASDLLSEAGISTPDSNSLEAYVESQVAAVSPVVEAIDQGAEVGTSQGEPASVLPATEPTESQPQEPLTRVWTGRSADGYATQEEAQNAIPRAQDRYPDANFVVTPTADGRFVLKDTPTPQEGVATEQPGVVTYATQMGRVAGPAPVARSAGRVQEDADAVLEFAVNTGKAGTAQAPIPVSDREIDVRLGTSGTLVKAVAAVAESAFGTKVTFVKAQDNYFGAASGGRVFINLPMAAVGDRRNSFAAIAIATIGHEAGHAGFEQTAGGFEIDKAYRGVVEQHLKSGVLEKYKASFKIDQTTAASEVMRDVDGAMWLDSKFWGRVYDIDNGSTFRKIAYKFMQAATKFISAAKGSRLDIDTLVSNVEAVREAAAQAWAAKAQGAKTIPRSKLKADLFSAPAYSQTGDQNEILGPSGTGRIQQDAGNNRPEADRVGVGTPSYGQPREGAVSVVGRHYSKGQRTTLSGLFSGTGLKGAESKRLEGASSQIRSRVYFYVDTGKGIRPESGVGGYAHEVRLDNIYDQSSKLIPPQPDNNAFEEAVVKAGFDGYLVKDFTTTNGAVVLLGTKHGAVPVRYVQDAANAPSPVSEAPSTIKKGLLSKEANAVNVDAIPGAKMRMGTLEVPADQRDAANAEMERIGSDVRYSRMEEPAIGDKTDVSLLPAGKKIPESVAVGGLESALKIAGGKKYAKGRDLKLDIQGAVHTAAKAAKVSLTERTQSLHRFLADMVFKDALLSLKTNENAIGWYDQKVSRALGAISVIHPEIRTEPESRVAFLWALAVTSNGLKVNQNFGLANSAYEAWKASGDSPANRTMPGDVGIGNVRTKINDGLILYNTLAKRMGLDRAEKFMVTQFLAGDINKMFGIKPTGEWATTPVSGASILGPKIGNGFYMNLNGYFDSLTMDRWLMRTYGRMTGTLVEIDKADIAKKQAQLRDSIKALSPEAKSVLGTLVKLKLTNSMTLAQLNDAAKAVSKATQKPENREIMNSLKGGEDFRKSGNNLFRSLDGSKEAPANPAERNWIRAIFGSSLEQLKASGYDMTMADLQALLWYPERRLYDAAKSDEDIDGGYEDDEAPDYANAAYELAIASGASRDEVIAAMDAAEQDGTLRTEPMSDVEKDALTTRMAFELAPDPANQEKMDAWSSMTEKQRVDATKKIRAQVIPAILDLFGVSISKNAIDIGSGGFMGFVNPNLQADFGFQNVSVEVAEQISAAIGYVLDQASVALVDSRLDSPVEMIRLTFSENPSKHAKQIFEAINKAIPAIDGFSIRGNNFDVLNFTGIPNSDIVNQLTEALEGIDLPLSVRIEEGQINSKLIERNDYESHLGRIQSEDSGRVLRQRLDGLREVAATYIGRGRSEGFGRAGDAGSGDSSIQPGGTSYSRADEYEDGFFDDEYNEDAVNLAADYEDVPDSMPEDLLAELDDIGMYIPGNPLKGYHSPNTPEFRRWFKDSQWTNEDGTPMVGYHGTAQAIESFRAKQAGAIFVAPDPKFTESYLESSSLYMRKNYEKFLTEDQVKKVHADVKKQIMAIKGYPMSLRREMRDQVGTRDNPEVVDMVMAEVEQYMPSGPNIIPVWVSVQNPFDFEQPGDVRLVAGKIKPVDGKVNVTLIGGEQKTLTEQDFRRKLTAGDWEIIESPEVMSVIRELGFDGILVSEMGRKNVAVFEPTQIKSVFNNGNFDPQDKRISFSRAAGPKEFKFEDNYLVPEVEGAFDDDSGNIAVMPAIQFAKDGIKRYYPSMPVRIRVGQHGLGGKQYGLQHRIDNQKEQPSQRGYVTPVLGDDSKSVVERAVRDITLGVLDSQTAYADNAPTKIYLHSPTLNVSTVLEKQKDSKEKEFWSVVTSMPSTREQMVRRYKAPTSVFGLTLNGDRSQQSVETQRGILNKLREPGRPQFSAESYIVDEDGRLFKGQEEKPIVDVVVKPRRTLARDENGKIILNKAAKVTSPYIRYSRSELGYYSALESGLEALTTKVAPANAWKDAIKGLINKGTAKAEEVEWSGVNDWLALQDGKVTKQQILDYLKSDGVKVEETVLGSHTGFKVEVVEDGKDSKYPFAIMVNGVEENRLTDLDAAEEEAEALRSDPQTRRQYRLSEDQTKYRQYTLPGGENYREVLLTLPTRTAEYDRLDGLAFEAAERGDKDKFKRLKSEAEKVKRADYKSSHWDQPNVIAHIRVNDRTDADGNKVMFVEEVQSDHGQDIKKKGAAGTVEAALKVNGMTRAEFDAMPAEDQQFAIDETKRMGLPPVAPFVTKTDGWLNLALKRIITMAVEGGYEKVAFVNGQQSADRYDLSKQISTLRYNKLGDEYGVVAIAKGKGIVFEKTVSESELDGIVGKEMAQKIINGEGTPAKTELNNGDVIDTKSFSGLDLKVGGEGMKTFYDSIVPQAVKKLISKMDGKLETVGIPDGNAGREVVAAQVPGENLWGVYDRQKGQWLENWDNETYTSSPEDAELTSEKTAKNIASAIMRDAGVLLQQPGFTITPKMQQQVDSGLPMFSRTQPLQGQNFTIPGEGFFAKQQRLWQDYFAPVKAVQDAILKGGGSITEASDVYKAEERMYGRVEEVLRDFRDKHFTPMIERATELDITPDEIALYAYAKHAPERNAHIATINKRFPDGGSGMTNAEAAAIIAKAKQEGKFTALEELHTNLMAITQGTRQEMLVNELITQDEFDALDGMFENYVPLRGLAEDVDEPVRRGGGGYNIKGKETIRALGRKTKAKDIMENIVNDYERAVSRGEKNLVGQTFLELIRRNPDPDLWEIDAVRTKQAWDRQKQKVKTVSDVDSGPDTVAVKVKGREVYIKIHDENLLRAMRKAYKTETSGIERFLTATLGGFNNMLRATLTQYNPVFGFVNWTRDFQMGAVGVADELGFGAVGSFTANQKKAMGAANRYVNGKLDISNPVDKLFQEFRMAGATTGGFYAKDAEHVKSEIRNIMLAAGAKPVGFIENVKTLGGTRAGKVMMRGVSSVGSVLEHFGLMTENATRFAAYMTARENGKSPAQAASIAKNLTTNFNRKGEYGQAMNAAYLFFNAAVQGSARVAQSFKNKKIWGLAAGLVGSGAMLAAYAVSVGGDDDDGQAYWDKIPDFEKERNFIIMLPPGYKMDGAETIGKDGRYIKIPMPYGFSVFPAMGYVMHDVARHQQDKTTGVSAIKGAARMTSAVMGSFNPFGGAFDPSDSTSVMMAAAPTAADVVIQQAMGVNAFGRKTAPFKGDFDTDPDSENVNPRQAGSVYHMIARGLNYATGGDEAQSGAIDVAPGSIENAVKTITGGTGTFMTDVFVNLPVKVFDASTGADAEITKRDLPLIRNFLGDVDGMNDSSLLYERRREIIKAKSALKNYSDIGLEPNMTSEQMALAYMAKTSNQYSKAMSAIRKQEIQIALNDEMTRAEKAKARKELTRERDELAQAFNEAYMEVMRGERDGDFAIDK